jgi:hypothetical protein
MYEQGAGFRGRRAGVLGFELAAAQGVEEGPKHVMLLPRNDPRAIAKAQEDARASKPAAPRVIEAQPTHAGASQT